VEDTTDPGAISVATTEIYSSYVARASIWFHRGMPTDDPDAPHDVLAAEEFVVPAIDPALRHEEAHDVLAAEEFAVPAPDPAIRPGPIELPDDPSGIAEPHDVLAAEEFALPAGHGAPGAPERRGGARVAMALSGAVALALLLRKRHR
jgi:hypothetical protein